MLVTLHRIPTELSVKERTANTNAKRVSMKKTKERIPDRKKRGMRRGTEDLEVEEKKYQYL